MVYKQYLELLFVEVASNIVKYVKIQNIDIQRCKLYTEYTELIIMQYTEYYAI